jgi:hypothetical protein
MKDQHDTHTLDALSFCQRTQIDKIYPHHERFYSFVPVTTAAKDWKVSTRRIRALLTEGRLQGVRRDNGYWEVAYPYNFTFGQRGPALKRSQKPERKAA